MDTEAFWRVLDVAKAGDKPLADAVADHLSTISPKEILAFEYQFSRLRDAVYRWDVWAAAYLIASGCSDDRFSDFTAGVVALGREWYEQVASHPDMLAEHPAVRTAAADDDQDAIFDEAFNFVSSTAYERLTGDRDHFWEAWDTYIADRSSSTDDASDMGESFDFDDAQQMRQRLPRLTALYLSAQPGNLTQYGQD
ncbi:DUF4240 domain-containing protein [Streptomyces sp. NPDC057072]|uniref:DUF4240 domain-containing protein n=1 Tax=Streptomyces sp. NPDC057072 TaxID=3346014 RepID=UPI0036340635